MFVILHAAGEGHNAEAIVHLRALRGKLMLMCNKSMWAICFLCLSVISIAEGQQPQIPDRVVKKIEAQGKNNLPLTESDLQKEIVLTVLTGKIGDPLPQELAACLKPNQPLIIHFATWTSRKCRWSL